VEKGLRKDTTCEGGKKLRFQKQNMVTSLGENGMIAAVGLYREG